MLAATHILRGSAYAADMRCSALQMRKAYQGSFLTLHATIDNKASMHSRTLSLQAGGAPAPQPIWQCRIPGNIGMGGVAMGAMGMGGLGSGGGQMGTQTECRVYAAPPELLDIDDLTAVAFATGAILCV